LDDSHFNFQVSCFFAFVCNLEDFLAPASGSRGGLCLTEEMEEHLSTADSEDQRGANSRQEISARSTSNIKIKKSCFNIKYMSMVLHYRNIILQDTVWGKYFKKV
jgi:hypothetical protein